MPDRILPSLLVLLEIRELAGDVSVDLAESRPLLRTALYRHGDQGDVAEGRFAVRGGGTAVGAVVRASGHDGSRGTVGGGRDGRGGCGRRGGIAIGRAVKGAHGRQALVVQVMVRRAGGSGGGGVPGWTHRSVQTMMGMMMVMMMAQVRR